MLSSASFGGPWGPTTKNLTSFEGETAGMGGSLINKGLAY